MSCSKEKTYSYLCIFKDKKLRGMVGWRQDNGNRSNQESKFDFLATHHCLVKIDEEQQKIKIVLPTPQVSLNNNNNNG